ncbi:hypothetical protein ACQBAU_09130 [Propionibacteriaceae bacterium Y2011]
MAHDDPFGLAALAQDVRRVTPVPAAEIRRVADGRRRLRVLVVIAAVMVGVVLTGVIVGFGATGRLGTAPWLPPVNPTGSEAVPQPPPVGGSPTPPNTPGTTPTSAPTSEQPGVAQPTWDNVPGTDVIYVSSPGDMSALGDQEEWGPQWAPSICGPVEPEQLDIRTLMLRSFGNASSTTEQVVVMGFDSEAAAISARDQIAEWYATCDERLAEEGMQRTNSFGPEQITAGRDGEVPEDADARFYSVAWVTPDQVERQTGNFENVALIQRGNRVAWLITPIGEAMDNNCGWKADDSEMQCPVAAQAPAVAEGLL